MTDQDQTQADEQEEQQEPVTYNIYVTGATSQTGLALIEKLVDDGHAVAAYAAGSKDAKTLREVGALPVYGDLSHMGDILGNLRMFEADTIVNLQPQALNTPPFARRDWAALGEQLQAETDALLTAAERAEVNYILHTSFAFLAGTDNADNAFVNAAQAAEQRVLDADGAVLRVGYLYSDAADDALHNVVKLLRRGMPIYQGKVDSDAAWLRADDLTPAVFAAATRQPTGELYHLVDDTPLSASAFLQMFSEKTGYHLPPKMPLFAAKQVYGPAHLDIINADVTPGNEDAKEALDWEPRFSSVDDGLEDILLTWRASGSRAVVQA